MEQSREDLDAIDEPRTRPAEEGAAVRGEDASRARGGQIGEAGTSGDRLGLRERAIHAEAAGHDHDDVGAGRDDVVPRDRDARTTRWAEDVDAAGDLHLLRDPVAP